MQILYTIQVQRHLQLRIEAEGKYLQAILEKAQDTLGKQKVSSFGLGDAKLQLSELVSRVSTQRLSLEFAGLPHQQIHPTADCSMDSCLTSCEGARKERTMHNISELGLRPYGDSRIDEKEHKHDRLTTSEKFMFPLYLGDEFDKHQGKTQKYKPNSVSGELDLNTRDESDGSSRCKRLDLNRLSWV